MYHPIKRMEDSHGSLNYMISWQSLDGRPEISYFETQKEAAKHVKHLHTLGRSVSIWMRAEISL